MVPAMVRLAAAQPAVVPVCSFVFAEMAGLLDSSVQESEVSTYHRPQDQRQVSALV